MQTLISQHLALTSAMPAYDVVNQQVRQCGPPVLQGQAHTQSASSYLYS